MPHAQPIERDAMSDTGNTTDANADADGKPSDDGKPNDDGKPATGTDDGQLGDGGKRALAAEREARRAAEARLAKFEQAEKEAERAKLSDSERLAVERDEHKTARAAAESNALRYEVALDKGLSKTLAKRLVGSTREELEADADELLGLAGGGKDGKSGPPSSKAREVLPRGGGEPDEEPDETDPAKLAAKIRRH